VPFLDISSLGAGERKHTFLKNVSPVPFLDISSLGNAGGSSHLLVYPRCPP